MKLYTAIRTVALFEACKGAAALLVAAGSLTLLHKNVHDLALRLLEHAHLNPAAKYPGIFVTAANHLQDSRILLLACSAAAYALMRGAEAYGLYHSKAWAALLAAASGIIYVPIELVEFYRHLSWLSFSFLITNLVVVIIMVRALQQKRMLNAQRTTS